MIIVDIPVLTLYVYYCFRIDYHFLITHFSIIKNDARKAKPYQLCRASD